MEEVARRVLDNAERHPGARQRRRGVIIVQQITRGPEQGQRNKREGEFVRDCSCGLLCPVQHQPVHQPISMMDTK